MSGLRLDCEPLIAEAVSAAGCYLYGIISGNSQNITVLIDKIEGNATADDCERVFDQIRYTCLDKSNFLSNKNIEVATPGLDRPILHKDHFQQSLGKKISVTVNNANGKKTFEGRLTETTDENIVLDCHKELYTIPHSEIIKSKWIFNYEGHSHE